VLSLQFASDQNDRGRERRFSLIAIAASGLLVLWDVSDRTDWHTQALKQAARMGSLASRES
jgi:hypothetical protein